MNDAERLAVRESILNAARQGTLAGRVLANAAATPDKPALILPTIGSSKNPTVMTYGALEQRIRRFMAGLRAEGFVKGERVVLAFPVSTDLFALCFAMFANGIAVVIIERGMAPKKINQSLETAAAKGFVSVASAFGLAARFLLPRLKDIPRRYSYDKNVRGALPFERLLGTADASVTPVEQAPMDEAFITFTSGSTGRPKGANRTCVLLLAQHEALKHEYLRTREQVDLCGFPNVTLHNLMCGITTVLPAVDFRQVSSVDPVVIMEQIEAHGVTTMTGSPAYFEPIVDYLLSESRTCPQLMNLAVGGAPVSTALCSKMLEAFPNVEGYVVYGSTEAEPMAHIRLEEVVKCDSPHVGYLVGKGHAEGEVSMPVCDLALLDLPKKPTERIKLDGRSVAPYEVGKGKVGEICVHGPHVNAEYIGNEAANVEMKLYEPDGSVWHRTGDLGMIDEHGLWLVGRVKDVLTSDNGELLQPYPLEAVLEQLYSVRRAAVVACAPWPGGIVVLEIIPEVTQRRVLAEVQQRLKEMGCARMPIHFVPYMPVDGRHNTKIDRPLLREWLEHKPLWKRMLGLHHYVGIVPHDDEDDPDEMHLSAVREMEVEIDQVVDTQPKPIGNKGLLRKKKPSTKQGRVLRTVSYKVKSKVKKGVRMEVHNVSSIIEAEWERILEKAKEVLTSTAGLKESILDRSRVAIWWTEDDELVGLCTVDIIRERFKRREVVSIYTGNAWLSNTMRNATLMPQLGAACAQECYRTWPWICYTGRCYWYFGANSFMSYRFATRNFKIVHPSRNVTSSTWHKQFAAYLGERIYKTPISPDDLLHRYDAAGRSFNELQGAVDRSDPDVDYFVQRNPNFQKGDHLMVLIPLTPLQMLRQVLRQRKKKKMLLAQRKANEKALQKDETLSKMAAASNRISRVSTSNRNTSWDGVATPSPVRNTRTTSMAQVTQTGF